MSTSAICRIDKNAEWKQKFLNSVDARESIIFTFDGVDELTDYVLEDRSSIIPKSNKRKAKIEDETDVIKRKRKISVKDDESEIQSKKTKKKKKKKKNVNREVTEPKNVKHSYTSMSSNSEVNTKPEEEDVDISKWHELFVPDPILRALRDLKFNDPTPIQALTLPAAIRDRQDIVGAAETGSGKTLAFGIPIITHILKDRVKEKELDEKIKEEQEKDEKERKEKRKKRKQKEEEKGKEDEIENEKEDEIENEKEEENEANDKSQEDVETKRRKRVLRSLIVTPTRELAIQIKNHLIAVAKYTDIKIMVVVGGMSEMKQQRLLKQCPEIVVGTPGRLWELIKEGGLKKVDGIRYLVVDEADRMIEKGHFAELSKLLELINGNSDAGFYRQVFVFSATLSLVHETPKRLIGKKHTVKLTPEFKLDTLISAIGLKGKPKIVDITRKEGTVKTLQEGKINCSLEEKDFYLYYFKTQYPGRTIVFCNSIDCVMRLSNVMTVLKQNPYQLHALLSQKQRLKNLERFAANENGLLITTDVAQRGLDIPNVEHIIHYQVPRTSEGYVHRSGRTARALKEGISIMFIEPSEALYYNKICKTLKRESDLRIFPVDMSIMKEIKPRVMIGRKLDQLQHRFKRINGTNSWFRKTAKAMDIELDEINLKNLDEDEVADYRHQVKYLKQELERMLRKPILPKGFLRSPYLAVGSDLNTVLAKATNAPDAVTIMKREKDTKPFEELEKKSKKNLKSKKRFKNKK